MHPFIYDFCFTGGSLKWSFCRSFQTEPPPSTTPNTPTVVDGWWGNLGSLLAIFTRVPGAEYYEIEVSLNNTANVINAWGSLSFTHIQLINHQTQLEMDLCNLGTCVGLVTSHFFVNIGGTQALNDYYYRVKACIAPNNCSEPSDYSHWAEGLSWSWW